MTYQETDNQIEAIQTEIEVLRMKILELRKERPLEEFDDYALLDKDGNTVMLSSLFQDKDELLVIHNMGKSCTYCTLWADGFSSLTKPLNDRVPFVLISPNPPSIMKEFSESRNWEFNCISAHDSNFIKDVGYSYLKGGRTYYNPGVSAFVKKDNKIYRSNKDYFGPGDTYNNVWHFFDLLSKGSNDWQPKYHY